MKVKKIIPQKIINLGKHLPKAVFANLRYGFPSKGMTVVGVTGTDGKTTTVNMIYKILSDAGKNPSMVSTINARIGDKSLETGFHVTSPEPLSLQRYINMAKSAGSNILILEVTSHALDQYRTWGIEFDIGVITNITHEHLDYHKTFDNYFKTKARLILGVRLAVLNKDEKHFAKLASYTKGKVISFGLSKSADLSIHKFPLKLKIPGEYNLQNALAAAVVGKCLGVSGEEVKKSLEDFPSPKGRMEEVPNKKGVKIIVDFAHTPNGLEKALKALKQHSKRGVIALIGAEGYRDEQKRAMMGKIATELADKVIITAVDPRGQIESINKQIMEGVEKAGGVLGKNIFVENDRQKAISLGIRMAKKGDTVGIFGKGHESSMNISGKEEPWSDFTAVKNALNERG